MSNNLKNLNEFMAKVNNGEIKEILVTPSKDGVVYNIEGKLKSYTENEGFKVTAPLSDEVVKNLIDGYEKYDYKMQWDGEQNFMLTNGCKEVRYKADAKKSTPEPEIVTPATGPAENILYIAIAAIILYGAYAIFFRKSDNN